MGGKLWFEWGAMLYGGVSAVCGIMVGWWVVVMLKALGGLQVADCRYKSQLHLLR